MTDKNIIAKVSAELKAQGINATDAQIESAIAQFKSSKYELTEEDLENVAGGSWISDVVDWVKDKVVEPIVEAITPSEPTPAPAQPAQPAQSATPGNPGGGGNTNTNSGKQISQQGEGNQLSNSGGTIKIS